MDSNVSQEPEGQNNSKNELAEPVSIPAPTGTRRTSFANCARFLVRVCAIGGVALTLWIIVGSFWFPEWWYGAIWRADLFSSQYLAYGCSYLLDNQLWLLFCIVAVATTGLMIFYFKRQFLLIVDKIAVPTIIVCVALLTCDTLSLHQTRYEAGAALMEWFSGRVTPEMIEAALSSKPSARQIIPPVDFHYMDSARVDGVYSEIEPDLVETERTMSLTKKRDASAGIEVGPATLKGDVSKERADTSKFERSDASAERKCIQIMNFVLKNGSAHYYTTINDFYIQHAFDDAVNAGKIAAQKASKGFDPSALAPVEPIDDSPKKLSREQSRAAAKQISDWKSELQQEVKGFVIVDGTFRVIRANGSIVFEEDFSPSPEQIVFRFSLPAKVDSDVFHDGYRIRVFGDVVQSTGNLKVLTIHPIAVFGE